MDMRQMALAASRGENPATDIYKLNKYILDSETELVNEFNKIVDAQIKLANISDKQQLGLEQLQIFNINELLHYAIQDPALVDLFKYCYYSWKGGLSLTRAKKGRERGLMAMVGTTQAPAESEGFGTGLGITDDEAENKFFSKLAGMRPRGRKIDEF